MALEMVAEDMLNAFSIQWKIQDLEKRLNSKRTPKKYLEPLRAEIDRLKTLLEDRRKTERKR